jgi:hypothetical protein
MATKTKEESSSLKNNGVPEREMATVPHPAGISTAPLGRERVFKAGMRFVHASAGIGLTGYLEHDFRAETEKTSDVFWTAFLEAFDAQVRAAGIPRKFDAELRASFLPLGRRKYRDLAFALSASAEITQETTTDGDLGLGEFVHRSALRDPDSYADDVHNKTFLSLFIWVRYLTSFAEYHLRLMKILTERKA